MAVIGLKLVSGEEIIGEQVEEKQLLTDSPPKATGDYRLKNPVVVVMQPPTKEGQVGVAFIPYLLVSEEREFTFRRDHVVTKFSPNESLRNGYSTQFGSGIVTARPGDLPPYGGLVR